MVLLGERWDYFLVNRVPQEKGPWNLVAIADGCKIQNFLQWKCLFIRGDWIKYWINLEAPLWRAKVKIWKGNNWQQEAGWAFARITPEPSISPYGWQLPCSYLSWFSVLHRIDWWCLTAFEHLHNIWSCRVFPVYSNSTSSILSGMKSWCHPILPPCEMSSTKPRSR